MRYAQEDFTTRLTVRHFKFNAVMSGTLQSLDRLQNRAFASWRRLDEVVYGCIALKWQTAFQSQEKANLTCSTQT